MTNIREQEVLSQRIVALCNAKGMTHYKLSYKSTVPLSTITNILSGKSSNPGVFTIMKICDGLDIALDEFFDTEEFHALMVREENEIQEEN